MAEIENVTSAHFIGIGGAGMSGIALVLHERGCRVTGSDLKSSHYVRELDAAGIDVRVGHAASTIDEVAPQVVVTSTAIPDTNPEVMRAHELGIPIWPRAKMLSWLSGTQRTVAVAGTHGKTTTSSMVATMLDKMGLDPSFLIGGVVEGYDTNGRNGAGEHFVCEADESDGSFLYLNPSVVVVTNIEADHLDHYGTLENLEQTFCTFMGLVGEEGTVVVNGDVAHVVELARSTGRRVVTYGFDPSCDFVCVPGEARHRLESTFSVRLPSGDEVAVTISANPGRHNMANATAAIAVASVLSLDEREAAAALSQFKGARRPPPRTCRSSASSAYSSRTATRAPRTSPRSSAPPSTTPTSCASWTSSPPGRCPSPASPARRSSPRCSATATLATWRTCPTAASSWRTSASSSAPATCSSPRARATSPRSAPPSSRPCASERAVAPRERLQRVHDPLGRD